MKRTGPVATIEPLRASAFEDYRAHFERHQRENGVDGAYFMPFSPNDPDAPVGLDAASLEHPLSEKRWKRAWVVRDGAVRDAGDVVGCVSLAGAPLRTAGHRCQLGMGLEAAWRGRGFGRRLMDVALDFARAEPGIAWVDLQTFGSNAPAIALYEALGFETIGVRRDAFRIDGTIVDDVFMTLNVARASRPE